MSRQSQLDREEARICAEQWTWVQPKDQDDLLARLADARDLNVPERERENLCACAYTEIRRLQQKISE